MINEGDLFLIKFHFETTYFQAKISLVYLSFFAIKTVILPHYGTHNQAVHTRNFYTIGDGSGFSAAGPFYKELLFMAKISSGWQAIVITLNDHHHRDIMY